jgi:hypothetical protein
MPRRYKRVKGILPVRVFAVNGTRRELLQLAYTLDISHQGASLGGLRTDLEIGQIV